MVTTPMIYETPLGLHLLGSGETPQDIQSLTLDGWRFRVVKIVSDVGQSLRLAPYIPEGTVLIHRWWRHQNFYSDRLYEWSGDRPEVAATRWFQTMKPELSRLATISHLKVLVETFNESGQSDWYADFCFEVAKHVNGHFGDRLGVAAFSSSSGSYNNPEDWKYFARFVNRMNDEGLEPHLSVHGYGSWRSWAWHMSHRQFGSIKLGWDSHQTFDEQSIYDLSVLDDPQPPDTWTAHAYIRLLWGLKNIFECDLSTVSLWVTESSVDDMGDPGIGSHYAGWRQWVEHGTWDRFGGDPETQMGNLLWFDNRQYEVFKPILKDIGTTPFTRSDQNKNSRWYHEFRLEGGPENQFKYRARNNQPSEPVPELPELPSEGCYIATLTTTSVNVRDGAGTQFERIAGMNPLETYQATHYLINDLGETWYLIAYEQNTFGWVAGTWKNNRGELVPITRQSNDCENLPEWKETTMKLGLVYLDHAWTDIFNNVNIHQPRIFTGMGNERETAQAAIETKTDAVTWFWWQYNPTDEGRGLPDYGNPDSFMEKMTGQTQGKMVNTWFDLTANKQFLEAIRKQNVEAPHTGNNIIVENEDYNPHVIVPVLNGDTIPANLLPQYFGFAAQVLRELFERDVLIGTWFHLIYGLRGAVINRDITHDEQEWFWESAHSRGLLDALVETGGIIRLKRKIYGRFSDHMKSEIFPIKTFSILSRLGYLSQLKFILQVEYVDGWQSQGITEDDVVSDLYLLEQTAMDYPVDIQVFLRSNESDERDWVQKHTIRGSIENRIFAVLDGHADPPDVNWVPETTPPPTEPPDSPEGSVIARFFKWVLDILNSVPDGDGSLLARLFRYLIGLIPVK